MNLLIPICCVAVLLSDTALSQNSVKPSELPVQDIRRDKTLSKPVTLDARRLPLPAVLQELQKQSGVSLGVDGGSDTLLLTAHFSQMPLAEVMQALARLYGREWKPSGQGGWIWPRESSLNPLELDLRRVGDFAPVEERARAERRGSADKNGPAQPKFNWFEALLPRTNTTSLVAPEGVALTSFPEELQKKIRRDREGDAALQLVGIYQKSVLSTLREANWQIFRDAIATENDKNLRPWTAVLMTREGTTLLTLPPGKPVPKN